MSSPEQPARPHWATGFDHLDRSFAADPNPRWAELRSRCPVAHSDRYGGMAVITRWDDIAHVAADTDTFTSRRTAVSEVPTSARGLQLPPINLDPPEHTLVRQMLLPFFSPNAIAGWEPKIRNICGARLEAITGSQCDAANDYAQHIPTEVTAAMLGVPESEGEYFRTWIKTLLEVAPNDADVQRAATTEMLEYMGALVAERKLRPVATPDAVTYLLSQELDGRPIPDEQIAATLWLLLLAGIDTTWSSIGAALFHLASNPHDRHRLVAEPALLPTAIEELLRAYAPVLTARIANRDATVGGCPVSEGDWLLLAYPSICRDEAVFDRPDEILIDRKRNRHAAFGLGVHRCIGSNLARLEMRVALEMWLDRFPDFELIDPSSVEWSPGQIRGPRSVPVELHRRRSTQQ